MAAPSQRQSERPEVPAADRHEIGRGWNPISRYVAGHLQRDRLHASRQYADGRQTGRARLWKFPCAAQQLFKILRRAAVGVGCPAQVDMQKRHVLRTKPEIDGSQIVQCLREQPGREDERQRQRDLARNQHARNERAPPRANDRNPLYGTKRVGVRSAPSRECSKKNAGRERDGRRKTEYGAVWSKLERKAIVHRTEQTEQYLGELLRYDPASAAANRRQ